ncbi:retention module-containing protein [Enterovibrio baiacu]|uniref:retention module-containing protein n=1 Tax=Enterovibrio baiacu TaxID=2491023 RepID=UPI003D120C22
MAGEVFGNGEGKREQSNEQIQTPSAALTYDAQLTVIGGQLYVIRDGIAEPVPFANGVLIGDTIVARPNAEYVVMKNGIPVRVNEPCATCIRINEDEIEAIALAENFDFRESSQAVTLLNDDISALQAAILAGDDPTDEFEPPAAGGVLSSSISGFAIIEYNFTSVLAEAGFSTSYSPETVTIVDNDVPIIPASGGESFGLSITEGDLAALNASDGYPVTVDASLLVVSGSLPIDPNSFVFDTLGLSSLLAELAFETKSDGNAVTYAVSDDGKTLTGSVNGEAVLTLALSGEASGRDATLNASITLYKPLDHIADDGTGLVRVVGDAILFSMPIQAIDASGNALREAIEMNVAIIDGSDPSVYPNSHAHNENELEYVSEPIPLNIDINSDALANVRFSATPALTSVLETITSNGESTQYTITDNAITVTLASDPSVTVFSLTLAPQSDGSYAYVVTQNAALDNTDDKDNILVPVTVDVTDKDGDTVQGEFTVSLEDGDNASGSAAIVSGDFGIEENIPGTPDVPAVGEITLDAAADRLLPDTLFISNLNEERGVPGLLSELNTLSSDGEALTFSIASGSPSGTIVLNGVKPDGSVVATLTLTSSQAADGKGIAISSNWTLSEPLDHENGSTYSANQWVKFIQTVDGQGRTVETFVIDVQLQARDSDGDLLDAPINVSYSVTDGLTPTIQASDSDVTDPAFNAQPSEVTTSLGVVVGSDRIESIVWNVSPSLTTQLESLTSNGNALALIPAGMEINGSSDPITLGYTAADGSVITVLTVTLLPETGQYKVVLSEALDQSDTVTLPLGVRVTDVDGDFDTSDFDVVVRDGAPPSVNPVDVDISDPKTDLVNQKESISLGLTQGSDAIESIVFTIPSGLEAALDALTSNGYQTRVEPDPLSSVTDEIRLVIDDMSAPNNGANVLTISLDVDGDNNPTGTYSVTQALPIDQPNDTIELPIGVKVTDTDGDAADGEFTITLNDVDPLITPSEDIVVSVDEPDLTPEGAETGYPDSSSTQFNIGAVTDRLLPSSIGIAADAVSDVLTALNASLTSAGQALSFTYDDASATLTGTVNGNEAMVISFRADQSVGGLGLAVTASVKISMPIDHLDNANTTGIVVIDGDQIQIQIPVQATDSDGDVLAAPIDVRVNIIDGVPPVIASTPALTVEESDINANGSGSNANRAGTTPGGTGTDGDTAHGKLVVDSGSDAVTDYGLDVDLFAANNTITSHGVAVTLSEPVQSGDSKVYTGYAGTRPVFTVTLSSQGVYTFTLTGALDHSVQGKDTVSVQLPIRVTDADGDVSEAKNILVNVVDDVPFSLETDGVGVGGGSLVTEEGESSSRVTILPSRNRGADDAVIKSVTINGEQHELVQGVNNRFTVTEGVGGQALGVLVIQSSGNVQFIANPDIDHLGTTESRIEESFSYEILDGDGDIVVGTTQIVVVDNEPQLIVVNTSGIEDQGRDQDPNDENVLNPENGIEVSMTVDVGDSDQGEHVDHVLITLPNDAHGTFYANGTAIPISGGQVRLDGALFSPDAQNELWTLQNVTFVPDQDYSAASGVPSFTVTGFVEDNQGNQRQLADQTFTITVDGIADTPQWNDADSVLFYSIAEDSDGATLNLVADLQDADNSETLQYFVTLQSGEGTLLLNGQTLSPVNGQYEIAAADINNIVVKPNEHFAGDITLSVIALSKESSPFVSGQQTADSDARTITVAVDPVADTTTLKVNRATGLEDTAIDLAPLISLTDSADMDGSEALYVWISDIPEGATLLLADGSEVTDINGVYEIAYTEVPGLTFLPPPEANGNFSINVRGVVKDTVTITNAAGVASSVTSISETASKVLNIAVKGVADEPVITADTGNVWTPIIESGIETGIETTIKEDGSVSLSFQIKSGEDGKALAGDNSETLTTLVTNIPSGVTLYDSNEQEINLVYAGVDAQGEPQYQAKVDGLEDVELVPPLGSTEDITLDVIIVVTEDDGDTLTVRKEVVVHIEPSIDASDFTLGSQGNEDANIAINWRPSTDQGFTDNNESITAIAFNMSASAIADGYTLTIQGETTPLTFVNGEVVLTNAQVAALNGGSDVLLNAPDNSDADRDLGLSVALTVQQTDVDSSVIDSKVITGDLDVVIRAVVEDGTIALLNGSDAPVTTVSDNGTGTISLSASDQRLAFVTDEGINTDGSSEEVIDSVVISFVKDAAGTAFDPPDQAFFDNFFIEGGINNGDGSWTVPKSGLAQLEISTSNPVSEPVFIKVVAEVQDQGDNNEGDASAIDEQAPVVLTLNFTGSTDNTQEAGAVTLVDVQNITGVEDTNVDLGTQLNGRIAIDSADASDDELSLIIKAGDLPANVSVTGMEFNYETSEYVAKVTVGSGGEYNLSSIGLGLPTHFAGDFVIPIKWVTTDTVSGNTKETDDSLTVVVAPEVDGVSVNVTVLETDGLGADKQPVTDPADVVPIAGKAFEDGIVKLAFTTVLDDPDTDIKQGVETVTQIVLTVDSDMGQFVDENGLNGAQSITVTEAELSSIYFKPAENYSGPVTVSVKTTVTDTAQNDNAGLPDATSTQEVTNQVSFNVVAVHDPVDFSGNTSPIEGNEDETGGIRLTGLEAKLTDLDGSEHIVSVKLTGLPDDFQVSTLGSHLVQNSGGGEWTISVPANSTTIDFDDIVVIPPNNFSGTFNVGLVVYTDEATLSSPEAHSTSVDIQVNPIGDGVDTDITTSVEGAEDETITLPLDIQVIDKSQSYNGGSSAISENPAETIKIVVTNVPDSATLSLPSDVASGSSAVKQPDGSWVIIANQTALSSLLFTPGDANELNWDGQLSVSIRAVDNGVEAESTLWVNQTINVTVSPVNDAPELTVPATALTVDEDTPLLIESIRVKDIDANESSGHSITVEIAAVDGVLSIPTSTDTTGITITGAGSSTLKLEGALDAINALLGESGSGGILYTGDLNFAGEDTLTVSVNDNGNTGTGGERTDADTFTVNVTPKPDAPTLVLNNAQSASVGGATAAIIPLLGLVAALTDAAETLSVEIRGVSNDMTFVNSQGVAIGTGPVGGVLTLTPSELAQLHVTGNTVQSTTVQVVAISSTNAERAESSAIDLNISFSNPSQGALAAQDASAENIVVSGSEAATLEGGAKNDTLIGGLGEDILTGGQGNDTLWGGDQSGSGDSAKDRFVWTASDLGSSAAPSTDTIMDFEPNLDVIDLSAAVDVAKLASFDALAQTLLLSESNGDAQLSIVSGGNEVQHIVFSGVNLDALVGSASSGLSQSALLAAVVNNGSLYLGDTMGSAADDILSAQAGGQSLFGFDGNDTLQAGSGNDILTGGAGNDVFTWLESSLSTPANSDTVTDFSLGEDVIDISGLLPGLGVNPDVNDLLPYVDEATVDAQGTIALALISGNQQQGIVLQHMDISSSGLNLAAGAETSAIINALIEQQALKVD